MEDGGQGNRILDHNGNKFYNFLCYPRLFRQYVHVIFIIIYIYMSVLTMFVLLYTYCTILPNKSNQKKKGSHHVTRLRDKTRKRDKNNCHYFLYHRIKDIRM